MATKYTLGKACIAECIAWDGDRKKTKVGECACVWCACVCSGMRIWVGRGGAA